jgi:phosphate transport system permease protein
MQSESGIEPKRSMLGMTGEEISAALAKQPRLSETVIQSLLFLAGALSIFTTIGIVIVLGNESLHFFSRLQWDETNKVLQEDIGTTATTIVVSTSGKTVEPEDLIRLNDEIIEVLTVEEEGVLTVRRAAEDTVAQPHPADTAIYKAYDPTVVGFLTGTEWNPSLGKFGIWPLLTATLLVSFIAMLVALPLGLASAIYLSEYASESIRGAGIPTVIYGYFALTFVTPLLQGVLGKDVVGVYNMASAGIVIGILVIPLVASMSEDAIHAVPVALREAAYGLGATRLETSLRIVLPAAISGIAAAFVVAISRTIGETMVVAIASGAGPNMTLNPFEAAETMTGYIARISGGDLSYDSIDYTSIFAVGLLLFFMTLGLNILSQRIVRRFREAYD